MMKKFENNLAVSQKSRTFALANGETPRSTNLTNNNGHEH